MKALRHIDRARVEREENGLRFWITFAASNAACVAIVWLLLQS